MSRQSEVQMIPRRCSIQETSFAAHVDGQQNREFVEEVGAEVVILVHGAKHNMTRFKSKLLSLNSTKEKAIKVFTPANCDELRIPFTREKFAKVVGRLAQIPPPKLLTMGEEDANKAQDERIVSGVLVQNGFNLTLMAPEDLKEYAGLTTTSITFKKRLFCSAGVELIRWGLEGMFGGIQDVSNSAESNGVKGEHTNGTMEHNTTRFLVMDSVIVDIESNGEVVLEWEGNVMNDALADSVLSVLLQMETAKVGVKRTYLNTLGE
jgi:cleavage and polyadenylation specificity factor subunit 3